MFVVSTCSKVWISFCFALTKPEFICFIIGHKGLFKRYKKVPVNIKKRVFFWYPTQNKNTFYAKTIYQ